MSYAGKVELWRKHHQDIEERHKAAKRRASESGRKGLAYAQEHTAAVQPKDWPGWFKRTLAAMDPRTWKSKRTIEHEAEVERKRLAAEAKEKREAQEKAAAKA